MTTNNIILSGDISQQEHQSDTFQPNSLLQRITSVVWPITRQESPKVILIMLLMFSILSVQNLVRGFKDAIVITQIAPEVTTFLKSYGVLPASILMMLLYIKLTTMYKAVNIFYGIVIAFLSFFIFYGFLIFPNHQLLHLSQENTNAMTELYPHLKWFILILSNWSYSLFYVVAELWPTTVFGLMFWQFTNSVTSVEESRRFYPVFGLLGQLGLVFAGQILVYMQDWSMSLEQYFQNIEKDIIIVQLCMSIVAILCMISLIALWFLHHKIFGATVENLKFKVRKKQSLIESLRFILQSKYIALITIVLICYGAGINLIEGPWKRKAALLYSQIDEYVFFTGHYLTYNGLMVILFVIIDINIIRFFGWFAGAIVCPAIMLIFGTMLFLTLNFDITSYISAFGILTDPTILAINIGMLFNALSKASKYTTFDTTKEMAYVPLDNAIKTQGKAAADLIGGKLGKSIGGFLQSMIFVIIPTATFDSISMPLMFIFIAICLIWLFTLYILNKEYVKACKQNGN